MKKNINVFFIIVSILIMMTGIQSVNALSASVSLGGSGSVTQGDKVSVSIYLNSADESIVSYGGVLNYSSQLHFEGCSSSSPYSYSKGQNGKIAFVDWSGSGKTSGQIGTCTFSTVATGTASVSISGGSAVSTSNASTGASPSKSITINAPKSTNANLGSLSVSGCSIGFNANTTSYSCSVDSGVTSANISATAADGGASVSGTGSKSLNYGSNKFSVTVKAPAGNTKTYTINITRKDNRSTENSLSGLTCSNCSLSPSFSSGTTNYKTSVEYAVSSLKLNATAKDSKAKVKINNNSLVAEETVNVTVVVTAENGSTKTYTISASRGKDPNKVLSKDNNLTSLTVDQGILSPAFTTENTNYAVYLPYEISTIHFTYQVSDTKYAKATLNGAETLGVGNNVYTISVKAEDESEKVYTINVSRAKELNGDSSNNSLLASLKVKNATLTESFDSDCHLYYYNKNSSKDIVVKGVAQDKEATVTYLEAEAGVYAVIVTAPAGNQSVYIMIPEKVTSYVIPIIVVVIIVLLALIIFIIKKIASHKKNKGDKPSKEEKKLAKEEKKKEKKSKDKKNKKDDDRFDIEDEFKE